MALEPINIFSNRIDPSGVAQTLRTAGFAVKVIGPDNNWSKIVITVRPASADGEVVELTFGHSREYYSSEQWRDQVRGMQGYFSRFPDAPRKDEVLAVIDTFRFALSVPQDDLDIESADERLALVYAVCRCLDAAIFTPSSLRDAAGRILIDATGYSDPQAVMPALPSSRHHASAADTDEDDSPEPSPPSPVRVMRRAMILAAVANRSLLENEPDQVEDPPRVLRQMIKWIKAIGIHDELEREEAKIIQQPMGTLESRQVINAMWRIEGLAVLSWALGLHPLPPDDEIVKPPKLLRSVGLLDAFTASQLLEKPRFRPQADLDAQWTHQLMLHWRLREFSLRPQPIDFVALSQKCWFGSFDVRLFRIINNDLAIGNQEISKAPRDAVETATSIALERHLAINWLKNGGERYSETDVST